MTYTIRESMEIAASPAAAYGVIADYRRWHPAIIPKQLKNLQVVGGSGVGAGTVITFEARVLGSTSRFRAYVTEPEPGRVLVETNVEPTPSVTTFTVEPRPGGSLVTISTEFTTTRDGLLGRIERWMTCRIIASMYRQELRNVERQASRWTVSGEKAGTQTAT